jgi:hypothetical protein
VDKTAAEWQIICLTHNLLKLYKARTASTEGPEGAKSRSKSNGLAHVQPKRRLMRLLFHSYGLISPKDRFL